MNSFSANKMTANTTLVFSIQLPTYFLEPEDRVTSQWKRELVQKVIKYVSI
jgi:hypothetical protein